MSEGRGCRSSSAPTDPFGVVLLSFQPVCPCQSVAGAFGGDRVGRLVRFLVVVGGFSLPGFRLIQVLRSVFVVVVVSLPWILDLLSRGLFVSSTFCFCCCVDVCVLCLFSFCCWLFFGKLLLGDGLPWSCPSVRVLVGCTTWIQ